MKLPNFRLYQTQAAASLYIGILSLFAVLALSYCVLKGFDFDYQSIPYNAQEGYGRFRPYLVYAGTAVTIVAGFVAGLFGFNSLGQKRNDRQRLSWVGLFAGALSVSMAPILFFVWRRFSEAAIIGS